MIFNLIDILEFAFPSGADTINALGYFSYRFSEVAKVVWSLQALFDFFVHIKTTLTSKRQKIKKQQLTCIISTGGTLQKEAKFKSS